MAWTHHGGRLAEARAAYGDAGEPWLDLSTGINPHAWPGVDGVTIDWRRLPDERDLRALETAAAAYFGVDPAHICALPGTETGLRLLGDILPGPARHVAPSYRTHGEMFEGSLAIPHNAVAEHSAGPLVIANPNNPDGRVIPAEKMRALLRDGDWLVVDEAFADPDPRISMADLVGDDARLVIFRSFGKFFGLAGVRLGFVLGPGRLIAAFRAKLGAWPISAGALAIGTAAYRDGGWIAAMRMRLVADVMALDHVLRRHGWAPKGDCPLFRLIEVENAAALFDRLARRAILTRPFDYDARWFRLGLPGSEAALARLDQALAHG
jgi:cobalamin biosynthetic protein CobC